MEYRAKDMVLDAVREALKFNVSEAEAYALIRRPLTLTVTRDGEVEVARGGESLTLGVRIAIGRKVAVGGGTVRSFEDVRLIVEKVAKIARASMEDIDWMGLPERISYSSIRSPYDPRIEDLDVSEIVDSIRTSSAMVGEHGNVEVMNATLWTSVIERAIANTSLDFAEEKITRVSSFASAKASDSNNTSICNEYSMGYNIDSIDFKKIIEKASQRALKGLKTTRIETGRYTVILAPKVAASIINSILAPAISAESVQKRRSPLSGRLGDVVLGERVTIADDPTRENLYTATSFDDEGVETRPKNIFKKGVLETFLYDTYTARKEGRESTGNAVRSTITSAPRPSHISMIVEPGLKPLEDIALELKRYLIIYETIGEWLSNPINGYLNATITYAELIDEGEFRGVVRGVILSGNIYDLLKENLEELSKDMESFHGVHAPGMMIRNATISSK